MSGIRAAGVAVLLALAGCSTLSPHPVAPDQVTGKGEVQGYRFSGRLAVHQPSGSDTAGIEWVSQAGRQHVELLSPLGSTVAQLDQTPERVDLVLSDKSEFSARDAEQLTRSVLGYPLPLEGLPWWVLGQADPRGGGVQVTADANGRPEWLVQEGWRIHYGEWRSVGGQMLPGSLSMARQDLTLRLKIDSWVLMRDDK